jgi:hypothetical protein
MFQYSVLRYVQLLFVPRPTAKGETNILVLSDHVAVAAAITIEVIVVTMYVQIRISFSITPGLSALTLFFSLIVFGVFYKYSSAAPQRTAFSKVPSQMAAHLRTGNPL